MRSYQPPHILIVDDDDVDVMILKRAFKRSGVKHTLSVARDGYEALAKLRGDEGDRPLKPDVILLDINMPRMNGHECLAHLRADPSLNHNVVFMFTTSSTQRDIHQAYAHQVAGYIVKEGESSQGMSLARMLDQYHTLVSRPA